MPLKKKLDDSDFSDDDSDGPPRKTEKRKPTPRKASPKKVVKQQSSALNSDRPDDADDAIPPTQGYSGKYNHTEDNLLKVNIPERPEPIMCADGSGSRLMIKEILVTNFKSYYGTQRIGPFHKNFSAIIGPNGSGKSNVIDSLLFVFGFRASRIRLKKLKELIHNSSGKQRPEFCTVEIAFQTIIDTLDGGYTVVENSEFRVGRTAYQDSTSKYTINGKTRTKDEIEQKLKSVGIDLVHNRFLILQGEVEQIALMKCKAEAPGKEGMLEYLEDIIGSSRLNSFISDIALKIDQINTDKSQQNQRVKAVEKERESMEGPVRQMISHLRCENQASLLKNKLITMKRLRHEKEVETVEPKQTELREQLETIQLRLDEITAAKKEKEKEYAVMEREKEKCQTTLAKTQKNIVELETQEARRKIDEKKCVKDVKNARDKLQNAEKELTNLEQVPQRSANIIDMKEGEIAELQDVDRENEANYERNQDLFNEKSVAKKAAKQNAEQLKGEKQGRLDETEAKRKLAEEELRLLLSDSDKHKNRMEAAERSLEEARTQLDAKDEELGRIRARLPECEKAFDEAGGQIERLTDQQRKLRTQKAGLDEQIERCGSRVKDADTGFDKKGVKQVMGHLLKAHEEGKIKNFYGRLGDLGTVEDRYQLAISATTSGLDSFIVKTKADGDAALDVIKRVQCGRHQVYVLDSLAQNPQMDKCPRLPAPRLFDLIQISKPEFRKAFYHCLQNTMLVDTMEEARRNWHNMRARYVTNEGGVMDSSGTMSGGGNTAHYTPLLGKHGNKQVDVVQHAKERKLAAEELEQYKSEAQSLMEKLNTVINSLAEVEQRRYEMGKEKQTLQNQKRILTNDTNNLNTKIVALEKNIKELRAAMGKNAVDPAEIERKRATVASYIEEHERTQREFAEADTAFQKAENELQKVYHELLGRFREASNTAKAKIAECRNEINTEQMKMNTNDKDKKKSEGKVEGARGVIDMKEKELRSLRAKEEEFEQALTRLQEMKTEYENDLSEIDTRIKETRKENSKQDEEEGELNKRKATLDDEYKTLTEQLAVLQRSIDHLKREVKQLKLHRIKDYGLLPDKVRKPAQYDHIIDEETLLEERAAHQKKHKKQKKTDAVSEDQEEAENSDGDDGALPVLTEEELKDCDRDDMKFQLKRLEEKVRKNKEFLNMRIIEEYAEKTKKYMSEHEALVKLLTNHKLHMARMEEWKRVRLSEFMEGFTEIGKNLKEMYQMITLGGDASLDLKDSLDPFAEGIQFMVRPPKKSWKNIENLSGGEKTLSSLSLVFALHKYRPTPLYVMDEIDAALDFRNVSIIGHYVKEKTKNAQFIIISLRNNMFELGDRLVGIYKTFDCTKNVVIDPAEVMRLANPAKQALQMIHNVEQDLVQMDFNALQETIRAVPQENPEVTSLTTIKRRSSENDASPKRADLRKSPTSDPSRTMSSSEP